MKLFITLLTIAALTVASCGSDPTAAGGADSDVDAPVSLDGSYELTDLTVDDEPVLLPPTPLTMSISDGAIQGDAGCNTFSGSIDRSDDGSLTLGQLVQTEMACEHLDFEITYTAALLSADRWEASDGGIAFVADNARITYTPAQG